MALSMTSDLKASDILEVRMLKDLKVYLLRGMGNDDLIIKIDAVRAPQVKDAGKAVKAIDPSVKMRLLSASELFELKQYCKAFDDIDAYFEDLGIVSPLRAQKSAVEGLKESLDTAGFGFAFTKMTRQTVHNIEDAATERGKGNKDYVRLFVSALKSDGGLEMLGKVVAGDLFNGNTDRFMPGTNTQRSFGPYTIDLKAIVNPGNVMVIADQGQFRPTMLDYVDPNSQFKNMQQPLSVAEAGGDQWPGRVLANKKRRHKFAEDIVEDLENILHPKKSLFSLKTKLGRDAVKRLERGMSEGAALIVGRLNAKYPQARPAGVLDRLNILGGGNAWNA